MLSNIVKWIVRVIFLGTGILGLISLFSASFSNVAFSDFTWGQVIGSVFVIAALAEVIQIEFENRNLRNKIPSIKIRPIVSNRKAAILEIYNNGGNATFTATAKIIKGHPDHLNEIYTLYWEPKGANTDIDKNGTGKILVALQEAIRPNPLLIGLTMFKVTDKGRELFYEAIWGLGDLGQVNTDRPPTDIHVKISITSIPPLKREFNNLEFRLSQPSITQLSFEYIGSSTRKLKLDREGYLN